MELIRSISDSPVFHSSMELYFLTERPGEDVLLFYINRPSVIVGRNQSIEAEVNVSYCRQEGIEILRRLSGGGTVYHDYGNINYSFIRDKRAGAVLDQDFLTPMISALRFLGFGHVESGSRKELMIAGKKISGTASHITRSRQLFHGTLLHRTDLSRLASSLQGDLGRRLGRVASVSSPVLNLSTLERSHETTEGFLCRLLTFFSDYYGTFPRFLSASETASIQHLMSKKAALEGE